MKYKQITKYVTDDQEEFDTIEEAQRHCDYNIIRANFQCGALGQYIDFKDFMDEFEISDISEIIQDLQLIIKFKKE